MDVSEARDAYYDCSGNASSIARKAAYAGIAVVWVFSVPAGHAALAINPQLRLVALLLVLCLALDLLQYVFGSLIWGAFARLLEHRAHKQGSASASMDASPYLNWPSLVCFWGKLLALVVAYICLARFIAATLTASSTV